MAKIVFAGAFAARLADTVRSCLTHPQEIVIAGEADVIPVLADTDVLVSLVFTRAMAQAAPRLKLVQVPGAGLDRIDRAALPRGVRLANAYGHDGAIAEYIIGAMISLSRAFSRLDSKLRVGQWESQWAVGVPSPPPWSELAGATLGILGYGHIGEALAKRAKAFDMQVWAMRRSAITTGTPEYLDFLGAPDSLATILQRADYLAITLPLTADTRHLLGAAELQLMKPTAILINPARAEIIDEQALYNALARRQLAGAALDVWYRYPTTSDVALPSGLPFHELDNVLMTPHVSGWTDGMMRERSRLIADNIERALQGSHLLNAIE